MSELLLRIHQDHAHTVGLLQLLERQLVSIELGSRPDWEIVRGVINYFLTYPALRHHPIEDEVLERMKRTNPAAAEPFAGLPGEHRDLASHLRRLSVATESLLQDEPTLKVEYLDLCRSFIAAQHDHMRREEDQFLPVAKVVLSSEDWIELDRTVPRVADPMLDATDKRFQNLRWQFAQWERENAISARSTER